MQSVSHKNYCKKIDKIRVISCIMVLLYHLNLLKGGFLAVCVFFTLSGYLGCTSALNKEKFSLKDYYINRLKKLYLPLIIVVFITIIFTKINPYITWTNLKPETTSILLGYNNFWQLDANLDYFTRNVNSPFTHLWYISILMQFELIFPLVFAFFRNISKKINKTFPIVAISILTIVSTVFFFYLSKTQNVMQVYYNTFARVFSILFGVLLALINETYGLKISIHFKKFNIPIFRIYTIIFIALCIFVPAQSDNLAIYMILTSFIATRLIAYAIIENNQMRNSDKHIKLLSNISYEIYLVQYPVIFFLQEIGLNDFWIVVLTVILTFLISIILHLFMYFPLHKKLYIRIRISIITLIIIIGSFIFITEEDHTAEMKELENKINDNLKLIEERNNEYLDATNDEKKEWNELLEKLDADESKMSEIVKKLPIVGIGDSVLLGCVDEFYKTFPNGYFDGKVNRNINEVEDILDNLEEKGKLGYPIILVLGSNGEGAKSVRDRVVNRLKDKTIYWPNVANEFEQHVNSSIATYKDQYENVRFIDWYSVICEHPEYLAPDKVHPSVQGQKEYVKLIYNTIYNDYIEEYKKKKNEAIQNHEKNIKNAITFYGNDIVTNAYSYFSQKFEKASYNVKSNWSFDILYNNIKNKVENKTLENNVVFIFDKETRISKEEYQILIDLCKDYNVYICNMTRNEYSYINNNVKVIDFYSEIQKNENYTLNDKVHLSDNGNKKLVEILFDEINSSIN